MKQRVYWIEKAKLIDCFTIGLWQAHCLLLLFLCMCVFALVCPPSRRLALTRICSESQKTIESLSSYDWAHFSGVLNIIKVKQSMISRAGII